MSNYYMQKAPSQTFKIVSSEAVAKTKQPGLSLNASDSVQPTLSARPGIGSRLAAEFVSAGQATVMLPVSTGGISNSYTRQPSSSAKKSTFIPSGTYSSNIRSDYSYNPSISFSLTQSNASANRQQLTSSGFRDTVMNIGVAPQQSQPIQQPQPTGINVTSSLNRESQLGQADEGPSKPYRFLKPATTASVVQTAGTSDSTPLSTSTSNIIGGGFDASRPHAEIFSRPNPEEFSAQKKDPTEVERRNTAQQRFSSIERISSSDQSQMQKLRQQNRSLNRQLLNLRIALQSGRSSELELLRVENKELREQSATIKLTYEERLADIQQRSIATKQELDQLKHSADSTVNSQRDELNYLVRENNKLKDCIDRLERERSDQQPRDIIALRRQSARWEDAYENMKLEHRTLLEKHQKLTDDFRSVKAHEEKLKTVDRMRDAEINSLNQQRLSLEEQVMELNNQRERQNGEHQKTLGKHADYERQINSQRREIDSLNSTIKQMEAERNDLTFKLNELKVERKNLLEQTKRSSASGDLSDSRLSDEKNSLLGQLSEKIDEIGSLKKRIAEMAAEMGRQRDLDEVSQLKDRVARLELDNQRLRKFNKNPAGQFDEVLKMQLSETQRFKESLSSHTEVIYELREDLKLAKGQIEQLQRETELEKLRLTVERKNTSAQFDIERQAFNGELEKVKKAQRSAEEKARYWANQNRKKDEFMKTHLLGKTRSEEDRQFIKDFFRQYEMHLPRQLLES